MNKKIAGMTKKIALVMGMVLITAFLMMIIGDKIKANILKENQELRAYQEWLAENCNCLANGRIMCPTGFELKNQSCVNEQQKTYTNLLAGCSEYNCSGEIKFWNNETGNWS